MGKIVGLSRMIKPEWLDKTVELAIQDEDAASIKEKLNDYLSFEIHSHIVLRKTREILLNVWVKSRNSAPNIHKIALDAYRSSKSDKIALHWAMILLAYPVFGDVTCRIGKISMMQDTFSVSWLNEKLTEEWGDRPTLSFSCQKILQTLKAFGVIENIKQGIYKIKKHVVTDEQTISVILMSLLGLNRQAYYDISELGSNPLFFPFIFDVKLDWLHRSPLFKLGNFNGKIVLTGIENEKVMNQ